MQLRQTNSAITLLLSEYRAIFKSAYVKGLTAAVAVAAPMASAQAATPADPADLPDDPLDFSADSFDQNIAANGTGTVALDHGSSLTFVEGDAAAALADNTPYASGVDRPLRGLHEGTEDQVANNFISNAEEAAKEGATYDLRLRSDLPSDEAQYFYYKTLDRVKDFSNKSTINFNWKERPNNPNITNTPVVIAGGKATVDDNPGEIWSGGTVITNEANGSINLKGYEGLDNVALQIDANPALADTPVVGVINNSGKINITNGTGIKINGNGTTYDDVEGTSYIGFNSGNITVDSNVTKAPEAGKYSAVGMHFTGPTKGTANRKIQNNGTITVNNSGADSGAITAGMVVDGGADNVEIQNNSVITTSGDNSYAIFVGNDSAEGVSDLTENARVALGSKSQIDGIVKINNQTTLTVTDNKDSFVLQTFDEKLQGSEPSAGNNGIEMVLTNSDLTLESGSDVSVNNIKEFNNNKGSTLTVSNGAYVTITSNTDGAEGANQPINLDNTTIINQGNTTVTGGQSLTTHANLRNQGTWNVESSSTVNVSGAWLSNYAQTGTDIPADATAVINVTDSSKFIGENLTKFVTNKSSRFNVDNSELSLSTLNASMDNLGQITAANNSKLNLATTSDATYDSEKPYQITNNGQITVTDNSTADINTDKFVNRGTFAVQSGSTANFAGRPSTAAPLAEGDVSSSSHLEFINDNNANLLVDGGKLNGKGSFVNRSTFTVQNSGEVVFDIEKSTSSNPTLSNGKNGIIKAEGSGSKITFNNAFDWTNDGTIELTSGSALTVNNATVSETGATYPHTFNNNGKLTADGSIFTSNNEKAVNNGTIELNNGGKAFFNGLAGTENNTQLVNNDTIIARNSSSLSVRGSVENRSNVTLSSGSFNVNSSNNTASFTNTTNGQVTAQASNIDINNGSKFQNDGSMELTSSTLNFTGTIGTDAANPASNVTINSASGSIKAHDGSLLNFSADKVANLGTVDLASGSTLSMNGNTMINRGAVTAANGSNVMIQGNNSEVAARSTFENSSDITLNAPAAATDSGSNLIFADVDISNTGNINVTSGTITATNSNFSNKASGSMSLNGSTAEFDGATFDNTGNISVSGGSELTINSDSFTNTGKIEVTNSTLGFRVDALDAHTELPDGSMADAKLSDLTGVTANGAVIELLGSNRTYTDANGETQQLVNHISMNSVDELDSALSGSGNSLKLNNNTAVTVAGGADSLTNGTFNLFTADSGSAADIASRNVYFDGAATFNAGSSDKMITSANVTTNFGDLTLNKDAGNNATNLNLSGSNISIGHSLSSGEEGFNSLTVGNDSTLTFNPDNQSPVSGMEPLSNASGSIGVNIEINGTNAQIIFAGAEDGTTHDWNQESGHNISINSGSMEVGNNVNLSTDGITITSGGTLDTQYGSTVTIRGDGDSSTTNFTNSGNVTNLGTIDLGTGTDTIGLAFEEGQGFTHSMGNGISGGGHIIVDMTGVGSGADWDQFNQFGKDISMDNGNVEITNRPELSLPTTPDANGNETISKQEIDEIMSLNPGENLYIETEQTKNTILTGLDNNEDKLVGGGWKAVVGKSGVETIGTNVRSHTTLYGTADDHNNIAINADGKLVDIALGQGSTLEIRGSGNIGAVTGAGIFKVTGDGTGDLGPVSVKDRTDTTGNNYADIDTTMLVASNKATIIARNISTQFDSNISDSTVEARNNISLGDKATIAASTVKADNDLALGNNASVTGSTLDAVHDITLGEFATVQSGSFTAGNDMTFNDGSSVSDSVLSATNNFNFNGKVTLENTKINGGSANVTSHTMIDRNSSLALTKDLNIGTSSENGTVSVVGNSTVTAENLNMLQGSSIDVGRDSTGAAAYANADTGTVNIGNLNAQAGSTINLDPSFDQAAAIFNTKKVANNTITNNINAGKNSVFSVGFNSDQDVRDMLQKEQLLDTNTGALSKDYGSVVVFNQAIKIASTASITVDGNPEASGAPATGAANSLNLKNNGTVLLTDQAFSADGKSAAITFTDTSTPGKVTSDKGKIYLAGDFNSKDTYNLFDNGDLSGASDLKIVSANGKVTGTLDQNGDFTLSLDSGSSGGSGGSGGATPRMFGRASVPVDRMLQTAFDSTATDPGTTFLHEVTTTGKGNGIEAEHAARLAAYAGANQALINAHNVSVEAVNTRLGFSDGSDIKTYSLNSNAMPQPQAQSDGDQQFYVYRGRGNLAAAKAPAQNNNLTAGTLKGATVWLTPTYQKTKSDGMEAQGVSYGSDVDLTGMSIGADYTFNNNITAGAAVNFGSGSADGRDTGAGASDDFNYFGLSVYAGTTFNNIAGLNIGNVKVGGDITYTKVDSDFEADSGLTGYGKLRGSTSDSSLSLGVNASLNLNLLGFDLTPHAGLRYTNFDFNEYSVGTNKGVIANIDQDKANIFSIPVGISVGREFTAGNWSIRPSADLTLTANMGDTDFNSEAHFGSNHASLNTEFMDKFTYGLSAGLELNRGNFSLGAKARYIGSSNTDEYSLSLEGSYAF